MGASQIVLKKRRSVVVGIILAILVVLNLNINVLDKYLEELSNSSEQNSVLSDQNYNDNGELAKIVLDKLEVKGRA